LWVRVPRPPLRETSGSWSNRTTLVPQSRDPGATPGDSTGNNTVPWSNGHDAWPTSRKRWFNSVRDHFRPGTPTGRATWLKPRWLRIRLPPWARLGRQLADHLGLEPGMLWVRVPPEPLEREHALVEQPGVLACLSRRRSRVQIPSRALSTNTARYANRQSGQAQTLVTCGFDSRLRHSIMRRLGIGEPKWL
jgi:hypothetical protein